EEEEEPEHAEKDVARRVLPHSDHDVYLLAELVGAPSRRRAVPLGLDGGDRSGVWAPPSSGWKTCQSPIGSALVAAALHAQGPDREPVEGDSDERPQRVAGEEHEVGDDARPGDDDAAELPPGDSPEDADGHDEADHPDDDVDRAPDVQVELVGV